jgi:uncharacterized protein (TIGR03435 family)
MRSSRYAGLLTAKCRFAAACLSLLMCASGVRVDTQTVQTSFDGAPPLAAVSIRPVTAPGPMRMRANPGRVDINSASVLDLISNAYGEPAPVPLYRISGVASWMQEERFDIEAPTAEGTPPLSPRLTLLALRRLLVERFSVRTRVDTVEGAVYLLKRLPAAPKTGGKLTPTKTPCESVVGAATTPGPSLPCDAIRIKGGQRFLMQGFGVTLAQLAGQLSAMPAISRPVIDKTGLNGRYDSTLEWVPPMTSAGDALAPGSAPQETGPSVFAALEEQFGQRLESGRAPVEILVIESAQRPGAN